MKHPERATLRRGGAFSQIASWGSSLVLYFANAVSNAQ
jgi:hypothetical protein